MAAESAPEEMGPGDLLAAMAATREALAAAAELGEDGPVVAEDWDRPAGSLDWSCRETLDHLAGAMLFYATHLATRATMRRPTLRPPDARATPAHLLSATEAAVAILAEVVRAAPLDARGFHAAGLADRSGFVAMGCTEIMIHGADIAEELGVPYRPAAGLSARVLARIFPWVSVESDDWNTLRWACGRATLGEQPRLAPDWYWQCAPLAEWDGTIRKRPPPR